MLIYRIETDFGAGCYQTIGFRLVSKAREDGNYYRHPHPLEDDKLKNALKDGGLGIDFTSCFFGFESIKQLKNWFYSNEIIEIMIAEGLKLAIYDVPDDSVYLGNTQLCFKGDFKIAQNLREKLSLETLFDKSGD